MTVNTNQLVIRKSFTNTKFLFKQHKMLLIVLKLQVQNIMSIFFSYNKKRFFFSQSLYRINCLNPFINSMVYQSVMNRKRFFFSLRHKNEILSYYKGISKSTMYSSMLNFQGLHRSRLNVFLNQLYWKVISYHRSYGALTFGLLNRILRFKEYRSVQNTQRLLLRLKSRFFLYTNTAVYLSNKLLEERARDKSFDSKKFDMQSYMSQLIRLRIDKYFLNTRFLFLSQKLIASHKYLRLIQPSSHVKSFVDLVLLSLRTLIVMQKRRRLFFFAGRTFARIIARIFSMVRLQWHFSVNRSMSLLPWFLICADFILLITLNLGMWYFIRYFKISQLNPCYLTMKTFDLSKFLLSVVSSFTLKTRRDGYLQLKRKFLLIEWWKHYIFVWRRSLRNIILDRFRKFRFIKRFRSKGNKRKKRKHIYKYRLDNAKRNRKNYSKMKWKRKRNKRLLKAFKKFKKKKMLHLRFSRSMRIRRRRRVGWIFVSKRKLKQQRFGRLLRLYSKFKAFSNWLSTRRRRLRRLTGLNYSLYLDLFRNYKNLSQFKKTWLFFLPLLRRKLNYLKLNHLTKSLNGRFESLWGSRFRRSLLHFRRNYLRLIRCNYFKHVTASYAHNFVKAQVFIFILPWLKFKQLYLPGYQNYLSNNSFRYKFYVSFLKKIKSNFVNDQWQVWDVPKLSRFRKIRRFLKKSLRMRFFGYRRKRHLLRYMRIVTRRTLAFYSIFKRSCVKRCFSIFFSTGLLDITHNWTRKLRRIKRKMHLITFKINLWNKHIIALLSVLKLKRKPFSKIKMKRFTPTMKVVVQVQRHKLYSKLYLILTKFLFSYRLTNLWLKLHSIVVFFCLQNIFIFNRSFLRRLLNTVRNSFYLRYYKNKPMFLNALIFTIISMYYRSPFMLNETLCSNFKKMWKHRVHIFDTFKLVTAVLWRVAYRQMSSNMHVKTVYMQIHGKINSGTRTKHFDMRVDYKPSFVTLQNNLSFSFNTADARTGTFGVQTWFGY